MCGIVGWMGKTQEPGSRLGDTVLRMLTALDSRGPDSAGVALYGDSSPGEMVLRIKLGDNRGSNGSTDYGKQENAIIECLQDTTGVSQRDATAEYLRLVVDVPEDPVALEKQIEAADPDVEVVSMGHHLEIVKQVGSPRNLDATYDIASFSGSHGIGHTRLSTESRIDLSHSQPFWAHGCPDLAIVHNGHITNYHILRRRYEQRGVRFYTDNDSEVIGIYLGERIAGGCDLREAMEASLVDLDGSFSYLAATPEAMGYARDPFALKPLLWTENDAFVAVATEEISMRAALEGDYEVRETGAREVRIWQR
jgi:glutamate synthase domain-containing protein 1